MTVEIDIRNLKGVAAYYAQFPRVAEKAAKLAINDATRFGARLASKEIRSQVNFPRSYIGAATNPGARLRITQMAKGDNLVGVITARRRATSLARFAVGTPTFGRRRRPPRVRVAAGSGAKVLTGGFFVKLKRGASLTEDNFNVGLAVRLKRGEKIHGKRKTVPFTQGVYLLYGPSVAQVFNTVRVDISEEILDRAGREFFRQFARLSK